MQSESIGLLAFWIQMHDTILRTLQGLRPTILERWETLLRAEPVTSPLANPDSLVYLMNWTLDRFFHELRGSLARRRMTDSAHNKSACEEKLGDSCACRMNPLLAYFMTSEIAIIQAALPTLEPREREIVLSSIRITLQVVAKREIDTFCAVCQRRPDSLAAAHQRCASTR